MKDTPDPQSKLTTLIELAADRPSRTLTLANGVFDLLHVGHLRYLRAAAQEAELLLVAVNSDRSTRAYKGPGRPVIPEHERAELVAALPCVDHVIIFDEPDVRGILQALRPDVHAKGTDYTEATVPERDVVLGYGGRIAICGDPKDHASSSIAERAAALSSPND